MDGAIAWRNDTPTGYRHACYANSFSEFGTPRYLQHAGGWILERRTPHATLKDAMGCYPLFCCQDWRLLYRDLKDLEDEMVSFVAITDPLGVADQDTLGIGSGGFVRDFKDHYIVDLKRPLQKTVSKHHRNRARKGLRFVEIEHCEKPWSHLDEWRRLYAVLVQRHDIQGLRAFSANSFAQQLRTPGMEMFRAIHRGVTVGMLLWYVDGDLAYFHLAAYESISYDISASYALFWTALNYLADAGLRLATLGGGIGATDNEMDGLSVFKKGWSSDTRKSYIFGRIFDNANYKRLVRLHGSPDNKDYFPAYRTGEFG